MKTIIERMCSISEKMRSPESGSKMDMSCMREAMTDINALSKQLQMTPTQVVILTAIVQKSSRYRIDAEDIAEQLGIEYLKFLTYNHEMEDMRKRGYIRIDKDGDVVIPKEVLATLKENKTVTPEPNEGLDTPELLTRIKKMLRIRDNDECTTREAAQDLDSLMELNPDTSIAIACKKYLEVIPYTEELVFYALIYRYYFEDDDRVGWNDIDDYFSEDEVDRMRGKYLKEKMELQTEGIITYSTEDGLITKDFFKIKDEIMNEILADVGGVKKKKQGEVSASRKLSPSQIKAKRMFYNPKEENQISRLRELLSPERFPVIRDKMKEKGLRTGFTCLFYGFPGTGKTETVYQIARESGRDLFIVDVSQIKSCWVGESEKNIKEVFNKYRACVKAGGNVPILLFNEADAIFGIRQTGAERAVDKMENSIQNIILQEMEDLDGILIATTNLTENLDKAFERRFLYKVRFDKPSIEAKTSIWKSMIEELSDIEAIQLARDYDFSGGQIENVCRKKMVTGILSCSEPSFAQIREFCDEESISTSPSRKTIGF